MYKGCNIFYIWSWFLIGIVLNLWIIKTFKKTFGLILKSVGGTQNSHNVDLQNETNTVSIVRIQQIS